MNQIRSAALASASVSLLLIHAAVFADEEDRPTGAKILESWQGQVKLELRKQATEAGFVADAKSWEMLWNAYRVDEKVPAIDFTELRCLAFSGQSNSLFSEEKDGQTDGYDDQTEGCQH